MRRVVGGGFGRSIIQRASSLIVCTALCAGCSPLDIALHGADLIGQGIVNMASKSSSPSETYCQKQNSSDVYTTYSASCSAGDVEIKSWQYNKAEAENQEAEAAAERAEAAQAASAPIYCLTSVSHTPYEAKSGKCLADEQSISKEQYDEARSKAVADATRPPSP